MHSHLTPWVQSIMQVACTESPLAELSSALQVGALEVHPRSQQPHDLSKLPQLDLRTQPGGLTIGISLLSGLLQGDYGHKDPNNVRIALLRFCQAYDRATNTDTEGAQLFAGSHFNTAGLYPCIKPTGQEPAYETPPPGLRATLCPFQVRF